MFEKVLVANRGEIAVRVMAACRELDITPVAVYSDADEDTSHTRYADEAVHLGGARAADSYLDQAAIVDAAIETDCDAVHPGYGFLAENAAFAERVEDTDGLTWVGPTADAMEQLGEKTNARTVMAAADVPIVPGTTEPVTDPAEVEAFGDEHGYPVAIKAEGGGGGRGMKLVHGTEDIEAQLESARREGAAYFDNDSVYLERYLENPRHVEVQILADHHDTVCHLGERDCSLQRRHQKVVEEGPSPALSDGLREQIGAAARRGISAADYTNAGTVEFLVEDDPEREPGDLLDTDADFYFLEVNTRIQVEHTVTEELTGIDIVKEQLRVAAGEPLSFGQEDVELDGHAIEFRINAEDPAADFEPTTGRLAQYDPPGRIGVRMDDALRTGDDIGSDYDSMIGKLVVRAPDRETCLARSRRALAEFGLDGLRTTIPFHRLMLTDEEFTGGLHTTKYLDEELDHDRLEEAVDRWGTDDVEPAGEPGRQMTVTVDGRQLEVELAGDALVEGVPAGDATTTTAAANGADAADASESASGGAGASGAGSVDADDDSAVTAGMDGTIVTVDVSAGDAVEAGDRVCVVEAMKMENDVVASRTGEIAAVEVAEGDSIVTGDVLVQFAED